MYTAQIIVFVLEPPPLHAILCIMRVDDEMTSFIERQFFSTRSIPVQNRASGTIWAKCVQLREISMSVVASSDLLGKIVLNLF